MKINKKYVTPAFLFGALLVASSAHAASIPVFSTGFGVAEGAVDSRWTLGANPGGYSSVLTTAITGTFPLNGLWVANDSVSKWLVPTGGQSFAVGSATSFYNYTTTFSLAGLDASTAALNFQVAADNKIEDVLLNGVSLKSAPFGLNFTGVNFQNFSNPYSVGSGFNAGNNTLTFVVQNTPDQGDNPTGLNVRLSGTASVAVVPEANTAALLAFALPMIGTVAVARRRTGRSKVSSKKA